LSTILILDDDAEFRELVVPGLLERGHSVIEAGTGEEATQLSTGKVVHLFIVDGLLPDTDGVAWIAKLRARDQSSKVIYVSRLWQDDQSFAHRMLSNDLMVSLVLHKPIVSEEFLEQIDRLLFMPGKTTGSARGKNLAEGYAKRLPEKLDQMTTSIQTICSASEGKKDALDSS